MYNELYWVVGDRLQEKESASQKGPVQRQKVGVITQCEEGKKIPGERDIAEGAQMSR